MLAVSTSLFGQLSMHHLQQNASRNLLNSGLKLGGEGHSSPFSVSDIDRKVQRNVTLMGFKFGGNLATVMSDSAVLDAGYKSGMRGGLMFGIYFSNIFTLESGLMYEGKGFIKNDAEKTEVEIDTALLTTMHSYDLSGRIHYLQIPLYGRFTYGEHVQVYATFGFYLGIPLMASQEGTKHTKTTLRMKDGSQGDQWEAGPDTLTGSTPQYAGVELGTSIGAGFHWPLKMKGFTGPAPSLFVDVKFHQSLTSIGKQTSEQVINPFDPNEMITLKYPAPEIFNKSFAVTAGFIFPISVK